jgi:hypothetical protein
MNMILDFKHIDECGVTIQKMCLQQSSPHCSFVQPWIGSIYNFPSNTNQNLSVDRYSVQGMPKHAFWLDLLQLVLIVNQVSATLLKE